ncbi:hypothetical protein Hanom_Chr13g01205971 [Helianthus anomalus]
MIPHATLPPAFPVLLLSSCPPAILKRLHIYDTCPQECLCFNTKKAQVYPFQDHQHQHGQPQLFQ